jgi:hypothetical protein
MMRIPIHSCLWFAINCSPLAASPTPRHPIDQVTYLHRWHQQRQPFHLTQYSLNKVSWFMFYMPAHNLVVRCVQYYSAWFSLALSVTDQNRPFFTKCCHRPQRKWASNSDISTNSKSC